MSKRATRGEWLERVRSWKASGQGLGEFAKDKEFSAQSLERWAWKLSVDGEALEPKKATRSKTAKPLQLVEVVPEAHGGAEPVTLRVGTVGLMLGRGFDREVLAGVLDVLEARR